MKKSSIAGVVAIVAGLAFATTAAAATFSTPLKLGSTGQAVKDLQMFLNTDPATMVATTGVGSVGYESTYFGAKTKAAVIKFQAKYGIPQLGLVGPMTNAKLTSLSGSTPSTGTTTATTTVSGSVSATLAMDNPAAGSIIAGQATADLLHIAFNGTGTVTSVSLKRTGISDQNTLSNVYLYDGMTRLTDGYSFNTNGDITINNLNIAVNGTKVISVRADVASATTAYSVQASMSGFTVMGGAAATANVMGNTMIIASGSTLASIAIAANTAPSTASVNPGITNYTVWTASTQVNTRSLWLKAANFRVIGSAEAGAVTNVRLYKDGVDTGKVATATMANGSSYASFDFSAAPIELTTGGHTFDVRADIVKGSARTVQFSLQQASDFMVYDSQVGVNLALTGTIANTGTLVSINAGSLTATLDSTFQTMSKVTGGSSNAVIAKYKLHAYGEDVKVSTITVLPVLTSMTPAAAGLQNLSLYYNGSQVGSQVSSWTSGNQAFNLGSQLIVAANTDGMLEVRADLRTTGSANYTAGIVSANLVAGTNTAEGQNSKNTLNVPALTGNTLAVQTGNLSVSKNAAYANSQTIAPNTTGVKIASFNLQNLSTSESVRVTNFAVNTTTGSGSLVTDYSSIRTSETSGSAGTPVQLAAVTTTTSSNNFSSDFLLAPNGTKTVDIFVDANSVPATGTIQASTTVSFIGVSSNVSGTVTATGQSGIVFGTATITNPPTVNQSSSTGIQYVASPDVNGTGAVDASKTTYNFVSTGGASQIKELKFSATAGTVASVKIGSTVASVQTISGTDYFSISGLALDVPFGSSGAPATVWVTYPPVGSNGLSSGVTSALSLVYAEYKSGNTTKTLCTSGAGTDFSVSCTATLGTAVAGNTITLTASTPTVKKTSSPVNVGTGSTSNIKVGTITVTANGGDVLIGTVPVSLGVPTGGTASNWTVKVNNVAPTGITQPTSDTSGFLFANGYQITKGTSVAFDFYADFTGVTTAGNADITLGSAGSFKWSDFADGLLTNGTMTKTGTALVTYNQ